MGDNDSSETADLQTEKLCHIVIQSSKIVNLIRESSFNMTRGDEDIEGGPPKIFRHLKGGSEKTTGAPKICILQNQQEGVLLKK